MTNENDDKPEGQSPELQAKWREYAALCHAMQSGVAMMMNYDARDMHPKHLRVGINTALCEASAMGRLLIKKGVITEDEYVDSLIELMRTEVERYKESIAEHIGAQPGVIKLDGY